MGTAANVLRRYWMDGLNEVTIRAASPGLKDWLKAMNFQIHSPISEDAFSLACVDVRPLANALAGDVSRLAGAALESIQAISVPIRTPKANAWFVIRVYYAAFFAGHALSRIMGDAVSRLDREHTTSVFRTADLYGQAGKLGGIVPGHFELTFHSGSKQLECKRVDGHGGNHERFWRFFLGFINRIGDRALQDGAAGAQDLVAKLNEIRQTLCLEGRAGGNWLSYVRNEVQYQHGRGTWFPYRDGVRHETLGRVLATSSHDPIEIDLSSFDGPSLERFTLTSVFIIALLRDVLGDLSQRCPRGRSFVSGGPHAYLDHIQAG